MSPKAVPGDPDFPYMMADTPEEFERVRRTPMTAPAEDPRGGERAQPTEGLREAIRDEIAGWPIGSGYYSTTVGADDAGELADFLLAGPLAALLDAQAKVERVEALVRKWAVGDFVSQGYASDARRALDGA